MNEANGRKEITDAVVIAVLSALATGLANWALEATKQAIESRKKKPEETGS